MSIITKNFNGKIPWDRDSYISVNFSFDKRFNSYSDAINFIDSLEFYEMNDKLIIHQDIPLVNRIGSESQNGEVYTNNIPNSALKILPITQDSKYSVNAFEIEIATRASQLVLEGVSPHFPIVYEFGYCENFIGYNHSDISVHFLISERASCDLESFLNRKRFNNSLTSELKQMIKTQCLKAISDMHKYLGICHNDLHLRNFLVMENEQGEILVLIHDFRSAEYRETYQNLDYEFFEREFKDFL